MFRPHLRTVLQTYQKVFEPLELGPHGKVKLLGRPLNSLLLFVPGNMTVSLVPSRERECSLECTGLVLVICSILETSARCRIPFQSFLALPLS